MTVRTCFSSTTEICSFYVVTTCVENVQMSGNFKDVREKSWKMGKGLGIVREKIGSGKIIVAILWPYQDVVAF